ncbi:transporter [Streptomyces sp. NBC_01217]|uniref:transporter n=1 Tax=Streptomyces sp. NBC_01217 TaxID=2903779 RepID=UPI002E0D1AC7|nr:transporter [Streptomyces sp. NBC_01217]
MSVLDAPVGTAAGRDGTSGREGLVAVFVRLKLALLRNGLRQSAGRRAAYLTSVVFTLLFAAGQLVGLIALRGNAHAGSLVVLLTAVLAVGWTVMPLFFPGGDETLDPSRLAMLPLRPRPLIGALLVSSLIGTGPLFTLCLAAGSVFAVARGAAGAVFAVVAVPLTLLVCVALTRAVATANTRLLTSRKGRDLAVLSGLVIAVGFQLVNFGAQRLGRAGGLAPLDPAADVVRWLPPASAIGAVDSASRGSYGQAAVQLLVSVAALLALLWLWQRSLVKLMTAPDGSTLAAAEPTRRKAGRSGGSGLLARLSQGRTGPVLERSLRYVARDPKTKASWVTALAIGLIVPMLNALQGTGSLYFACFAAGMLGMQMYNQFGQDTSAFWMVALTISSTRDAYLELRARALALLLITLPYTILVTAVTAALLGDWGALPKVMGLSFAMLGAMLATGAVASATFPYSIPQDGFKNVAPGQVGLAWISIFGGMASAALLCAPVIAVTVWLHLADLERWLWLLLPAGAGYGALIAWAGLRIAAPRTANRLPEILAAVSKG